MNSESFVEYLAQPAKLYQLPYQEIKNLVAEYPYAGNLRLMMLIKSKIEQDPAFETHLHQLAAHTFDRDYLFDLNHQGLKDMLDLATGLEERLELKQLSIIDDEELVKVNTSIEVEEPILKAAVVPTPIVDEPIDDNANLQEEAPFESVEEVDLTINIPPITKPEQQLPVFKVSIDLIDDISLISLLSTEAKVQLKEKFPAWKVFSNGNNQNNLDHLKNIARQNTAGFSLSTQQTAASSVKQKPGVATETLAKLLERQGSYQKAIKMYEQLSLLNPEKNRYFAAIIEKLKQNI